MPKTSRRLKELLVPGVANVLFERSEWLWQDNNGTIHLTHTSKLNFAISSFLEEIGKHHKQPYGVLGLLKQLLRDVSGGKEIMISGVLEGTHKIEEILQVKKT
ncbi:hypothetical protein L1987_87529 [Smallanthus sonchifolius]|nr:hypothetical protein L1987_87529 [Smallanthus sonchifolius]